MEQRLKERMIGAIVLVAIAILLVPALLDGPGQETVRQELQLEPGARTRTVDIALNDQVSQPAESARSARPAAQPAAAKRSAVSPPASSATMTTSPSKQAVAPKPAPAKPAPAKADKAVAAAAPSKPAAAGNWAAQVGSFSKKSSATRITRELKASGFDAYVSEITQGDRTLYRVRVGPVISRAEAQALVTRLSSSGHAAKVMPHP